MNKEWFVFKGTHHLGPFSKEEIAEFYHSKEISDQTLVWKEGSPSWEPLHKTAFFEFLFKPTIAVDAPPPIPSIPVLPKAPKDSVDDEELPPPIPLDAILDPTGEFRQNKNMTETSNRWPFAIGLFIFVAVIAWYGMTQRDANIQLRIRGLMPVYLEKLETMATKKSNHFEAELALSLDGLTLWGSSNYPGLINVKMELKSIPKRVLGTDDVELLVKGDFDSHLGKFTRMTLLRGSKFLPGEYTVHVSGKEIHYINRHLKKLSQFSFFRSFNKSYSYDGRVLIYAGTPREFEKRLADYAESIFREKLKPFQDKLERIQTFESILNATSQNYLLVLETAKTGSAIKQFEAKFIKEISPLLQTLVVKANELAKDPVMSEQELSRFVVAPYRDQVLLGKQIGEMASDMITKTIKIKKLSDKNKSDLRLEFDKKAKNIKLQIDMNIKKLEQEIQKNSI